MGARNSQQRYVQDCGYMGNIRATQYGSWTRISLTDEEWEGGPAEQEVETGRETEAREVEASACSQILTQPPQDSVIKGMAEKLMDVETDVTSLPDHLGHQAVVEEKKPKQRQQQKQQQQQQQQQQHETQSPATRPHTQAQTPQRKYTPHFSISTSPLYNQEKAVNREVIAEALQDHFESLTEQVQRVGPDHVAEKLYGIAVLDKEEMKLASNEWEEPVEEPARVLMQLVKKKLWKSPCWFVDVCKVLRACGVKAISQVIEHVQQKCPTEEVSILSGSTSTSTSASAKSSTMRRQTSCHDMFAKLEESFKASGLPGATEFVRQVSAQQPQLGLIHEACLCGVEVSTLDLLLDVLSEKNLDINSKTECGQTPLHLACAGLKPPAESDPLDFNVEQRLKIEHLLSHKASNWIKDKDGNTPLHLAVLRGDKESVSTLLSYGKKCLNSVNKRGNSALHLACKLGLLDIMKTLCEYNADPSLQNKKMKTALHLACIHDHNEVALELASHDQSTLDAFDNHRMTPLHIVSRRGNDQLVLSLLKLKNCSPNKIDKDDRTPLHYACMCGNVGVAGALLEKCSSPEFVDAKDKFGNTALHIASSQGYKDLIKELLHHKANKEMTNQEGKTAMDIAVEGEYNTIATKMLRKRNRNYWRVSLRRVRKMRRTGTQASLISSSEMSEILENSSEESEDETVGVATPCQLTPPPSSKPRL